VCWGGGEGGGGGGGGRGGVEVRQRIKIIIIIITMPVWRGTRCDLLNEVGRFAMAQAYVNFTTGESFGKEKKRIYVR